MPAASRPTGATLNRQAQHNRLRQKPLIEVELRVAAPLMEIELPIAAPLMEIELRIAAPMMRTCSADSLVS